MKQRWIGFFAFPVCDSGLAPKASMQLSSPQILCAYAYARLLRASRFTRRPASEGVAVDDQDSDSDNEDESGINA
jgi:hypothetical protein